MQLTNKSTGRYFWREAGNRLFIELDGKPFEIKYTLAQNEAYQAMIIGDKEKAKLAEADAKSAPNDESERDYNGMLLKTINKNIDHAARIVEIAMNPNAERQYSKDQILEIFSDNLDLLQIVSRTWVEKKVLNPVLDSVLDPYLAP
ncbi:MAG TPA: hypothetical protein DCG57_01620 [Candidatus Riflebacteria bacterium]|nr:hypothetical protein [Candidatus Riflebacteria bacterium]